MFQDSIRLFVHPNKETILDIIQSVTFKGAICLYTLAWVILRIIMGNAGIDVLHILPILDHKLVYVNYIIVFIVDYIYIMFKTIILASLLWLLLKWWHSTSLKSFIVMTIYSMGLCFLFASIKFYLQSYFLSLNYLDNNWSFIMWNIAGLFGNILIFYSWIVYLMILYRLTNINKYLLIVCTALICYVFYATQITISI